ncbi:condensin subunit ScpA [Acetitomaculum ruminis DSM 5522]|uniref:Segregation and condensation protein A n=1 Tax=Acetitomaculum ruminis DSM 5522 TaxID=1120918 RepID=A0A1I0UZD6_9FIRM|nr:segregation/condensation protein A [Acetitomaculum ruminis]SFA69454.1 condensin subunit ScpA [Acetitomaculum ruminis DSM 5522]
MDLAFKLDAFEGPLDLLLHLIQKNKVKITDIPIAEITRQYLQYIEDISYMDLELASDFLYMAAKLLEIKSAMLLPKKNEEGEEIDPRQELVSNLLEYKLYKYVSRELDYRFKNAEPVLYGKGAMPKEVLEYRPEIKTEELFEDMNLYDLFSTFKMLLLRSDEKIDPVRSKFGKIPKETVTMAEKLDELRDFAKKRNKFRFSEFVKNDYTKMDIIVSFICLLELVRKGKLLVLQNEMTDDIQISIVEESGADIE